MASQIIDERLSDQLASSIAATDRIASLDVLRGFALLGILLANIQDFGSPAGILHDIPLDVVCQRGAHHALDVAVMIAQWIFVEGKIRARSSAEPSLASAAFVSCGSGSAGVTNAAFLYSRAQIGHRVV